MSNKGVSRLKRTYNKIVPDMDTDPPPTKRAREMDGDNIGAYIPDNGGPHASIMFSLKEGKGALVRALKPFEVRVLCDK